ncbi:MAG: nuclear transport factor 2 family protein [Verrucomicrobia bacterium]|nr:nuclear transport factor 2 family protein [Verrucomicrobiota bacterium]
MKIISRLVLLAALTALGFWLWTVFFPSPEKVIHQRLTELTATATFGTKDSAIARGLKAQRLANLFSADAQLIFDAPGVGQRILTGREEIRETAAAGFQSMPSLAAEFLDVSIRVAVDRRAAEVSCTAKIRSGDNKDFGVQEMKFVFKKIEGKWLIARVETVKTLS